jgi:hypothetical protein
MLVLCIGSCQLQKGLVPLFCHYFYFRKSGMPCSMLKVVYLFFKVLMQKVTCNKLVILTLTINDHIVVSPLCSLYSIGNEDYLHLSIQALYLKMGSILLSCHLEILWDTLQALGVWLSTVPPNQSSPAMLWILNSSATSDGSIGYTP